MIRAEYTPGAAALRGERSLYGSEHNLAYRAGGADSGRGGYCGADVYLVRHWGPGSPDYGLAGRSDLASGSGLSGAVRAGAGAGPAAGHAVSENQPHPDQRRPGDRQDRSGHRDH